MKEVGEFVQVFYRNAQRSSKLSVKSVHVVKYCSSTTTKGGVERAGWGERAAPTSQNLLKC